MCKINKIGVRKNLHEDAADENHCVVFTDNAKNMEEIDTWRKLSDSDKY